MMYAFLWIIDEGFITHSLFHVEQLKPNGQPDHKNEMFHVEHFKTNALNLRNSEFNPSVFTALFFRVIFIDGLTGAKTFGVNSIQTNTFLP